MKSKSNLLKSKPLPASLLWQFTRYFLLFAILLGSSNLPFNAKAISIENPTAPTPGARPDLRNSQPSRTAISSKPSVAVTPIQSLINGIGTDFTNSSVITILDNTAASPYPATITVTGYTGEVLAVSVSLNNFAHRYVDDVDILLVGPNGQATLLMSDAGFNVDTSQNPLNLTFADSATSNVPSDTISSGVYKPTDYNSGFCPPDNFPAPAPTPPSTGNYSVTLSIFNGLNPNGVWSLYVVDDCGGGDGVISGGWTLTLYKAGSSSSVSGSNQTAAIQTAFASPLVAKVTDGNNNPVSGQAVIFAAPSSGASGTFANGSNIYTATTNAAGFVTSTVFTANNIIGTYNVTASAGTLANATVFTLTNSRGTVAGGATVITGTNQAATINSGFNTSLVAQLTDVGGNPITDTTVITFTAPTIGASGTFANGSNVYTATTNASGVVTVPVFTANSFAGTYVVTATAGLGVVQAKYTLTNQTDTTADRVYGQDGSFTTNTRNKNGISANSLSNPFAMSVDSSGNLYLADSSNNRILYYPAGSTTATRVYGQNGSFITNTANLGGISATSLNFPGSVVVDSSGGLYIADSGNNRILYYPVGSTTATRVYGQNGSFITNTANLGGVSATSLSSPDFLALDSNGGLYVSDWNNHRVLYYPAGSTTATRVYGQNGDFTTKICDVSATRLCYPEGLALDKAGGLYVADSNNYRVVYYPPGSTTASRVYGQNGDFNSATPNKGGISAASLAVPIAVALDSSGGLYVTDYVDYRVTYFANDGDTIADRVYGQTGSFISAVKNKGGVSADSLWQGGGILVDATGNLYVSDTSNHRVLYYSGQAIGSLQLENSSYSQFEGGSVVVTVTRTGGSQLGTVATISPTNITASSNDYTISPSLLSWAAGDTTPKTVTVSLNLDTLSEPIENFVLTLGSYNGGINLGTISTATVSILDGNCSNYLLVTSTADDGSCGTLRAALSAASVNAAGSKEVTIGLTAGAVINLSSGLTLASGVGIKTTASCANGPAITLAGNGTNSGVGLTLLGNNAISGLWVRGFSDRQISTVGGGNKLYCVKASQS